MEMFYDYIIFVMWAAYLVYWWANSTTVKETERKESMPSRLIRFVTILTAVVLLGSRSIPLGILDERFLPTGATRFWIGCGLTLAGLLFSVWARIHLGSNWSQVVAIKEGHQLITSGPYAFVRHPIYTGLLLAFIGSAVALGQWRGLLAVVLVFGVLWYKLRLEETWLRLQFGDSYDSYCRRVRALVPYIF